MIYKIYNIEIENFTWNKDENILHISYDDFIKYIENIENSNFELRFDRFIQVIGKTRPVIFEYDTLAFNTNYNFYYFKVRNSSAPDNLENIRIKIIRFLGN